MLRPVKAADRNAIFVREGRLRTSAGVTTGIDMALAMVEDDHGAALADAVAARLVLYARRPGYQSQFSDALVAQTNANDPLGPAIAWARTNIRTASIERLARRAGMSLRTFHRRCLTVLGTTPAKLLEKLRVERARALLGGANQAAAKTVAADCGFGTLAQMNRAFSRSLGVKPREYRPHVRPRVRGRCRPRRRDAHAFEQVLHSHLNQRWIRGADAGEAELRRLHLAPVREEACPSAILEHGRHLNLLRETRIPNHVMVQALADVRPRWRTHVFQRPLRSAS